VRSADRTDCGEELETEATLETGRFCVEGEPALGAALPPPLPCVTFPILRRFFMSFKAAPLLAAGLAFASLCLAPPARAADDWGAIAIDTTQAAKEPSWGVGGGASEDEASGYALDFCLKTGTKAGCRVVVTYQQCGAFASDGHEAGWSKAPTKTEAESGAINACGGSGCKLVTSDCN